MNDEKSCYFDLSLVSIEKSVLITFFIRLMTYYFQRYFVYLYFSGLIDKNWMSTIISSVACGAIVVVIVWQLNLQLPMMPSLPITTNVVRSNPTHCHVYSIQHYVIKFVNCFLRVPPYAILQPKTKGFISSLFLLDFPTL